MGYVAHGSDDWRSYGWRNRLNYRFVKDDKQELYKVVELSTDHVVHTTKNLDEAKKVTRKWNTGIAFDGWTPNFILQKTNLKTIFSEVGV
jgi:hypothetical protein